MSQDLTDADDPGLLGDAAGGTELAQSPRPGLGALLALAWPLVVSSSFTTVQVTISRLFLSWHSIDAATAAVSGVIVFWLPFVLLWTVAGYVATFVAQYTGAGRPLRVGPAAWQGLYFSLAAGLLFLIAIPFADDIFALIGHSPTVQPLEATYFRCLCWMALPALITATTSAFFSGRGDTVTVIYINALGAVVNAFLDYCLIFGNFGFPEMGITGAGWAIVAGTWAPALLGMVLMLRRKYRQENATLSGWRLEPGLFRRLMRYGVPSGVQWTLDMTAFTAFMVLIGWFGHDELAATNLVFAINALAFMPMLGVGQAVTILVGKHLGEDRPGLAERMTWLGMAVAGAYMGFVAFLYVALPSVFIVPFQGNNDPAMWQPIAERAAVLLWFVALYSLFDAANIVLSFALRGAGDTVFVSQVSLFLAWPVMVVPSWLAWKFGWGLYWAWGFATAYICVQGLCFLVRFRGGKWRSMRVIESAVIEEQRSAESVQPFTHETR
jgi:MATE family multidrug resistance protein